MESVVQEIRVSEEVTIQHTIMMSFIIVEQILHYVSEEVVYQIRHSIKVLRLRP